MQPYLNYATMYRNFTIFLFLIGLFGAINLHAQELSGTAAAHRIKGAVRIRLEANGTEPVFVVFDESKAAGLDEITRLQQHIFGGRPEDTWKLIRSEDDRIGMTHVRYQQQYRELDVEGQVYIFHAKEGKIISANGHFLPAIHISTTPVLTAEKALMLAAAGMKQPFALEHAEHSEAHLVVLPLDRRPVLAYKCELFSRKPLVNQIIYVDANDGKILHEVSQICSTDVPGTAVTHFSGTQPIVTDQVSNGFLLRESGRGNGIETYNNSTQALYFDADNHWDNVNASNDQFAGDAHFGVETAYDFFHDHFGRDSYDNNGGVIRSYINDVNISLNASWLGGTENAMYYGNGNSDYFPFVSLEIIGHELSHGVTEYSAGLQYWNESGALNESFSDIFGITIRFLNTPAVATWYCGDQLVRPGASGAAPFRNMSNPNEFASPDTYGGMFFNNGDIVHYNSGIQNFWYYLLVEGGTGTNDIGNTYGVTGIGLEDAMQIAYRNLAYYLTPTSTFSDARNGAEQAAIDLFGICSLQQIQTINAWYAVGVGGNNPSFQPVASYTTSNDFSCEAPLNTQFFGNGDYLSYYWDFGDGNTSTLKNPTHIYDNAGYYTITLIVSNQLSCIHPDTLIVPNGIVIDTINPVAAFTIAGVIASQSPVTFMDQSLYGPFSWEWDLGDGNTSTLRNPAHTYADTGSYTVTLIVHNCYGSDTLIQVVQVMRHYLVCEDTWVTSASGVIFDAGGPNGDYTPGTCMLSIRPCNASLITLTIDEFVMDPDGILITDGIESLAYLTGTLSQTTFTSITGRLEIYYYADTIPDGLPGFRISYTSEPVILDSNSAAVNAIPSTSCPGEIVSFYDASEHRPVSWFWNFGDGEVSYLKNPEHAYQDAGTYNVTLTVTYCDGFKDTDTISYFVYCDDTGLHELSSGNLLKIFPNPSKGLLTLSADVMVFNAEMRVYDLSGREVYRHDADEVSPQGTSIDIGRLSNGQYILETIYELNGAMTLERYKIQVQH